MKRGPKAKQYPYPSFSTAERQAYMLGRRTRRNNEPIENTHLTKGKLFRAYLRGWWDLNYEIAQRWARYRKDQ